MKNRDMTKLVDCLCSDKKKMYVITETVLDKQGRPVIKKAHVETGPMQLRIKWSALVEKHCKKGVRKPVLLPNENVPMGFSCNDGTYILVTDKVKVTE